MKKTVTLAIFLALFVVSCKKNRVNDPSFIPQEFTVTSHQEINRTIELPLGVESEIVLQVSNPSGDTIEVDRPITPTYHRASLKIVSPQEFPNGSEIRIKVVPVSYIRTFIDIGNVYGRKRLYIQAVPRN